VSGPVVDKHLVPLCWSPRLLLLAEAVLRPATDLASKLLRPSNDLPAAERAKRTALHEEAARGWVTAAHRSVSATRSQNAHVMLCTVWLSGGWDAVGDSASPATANWPAITVVIIVEVLRGERAPALPCALAHRDVCLLLIIILRNTLTHLQLQERFRAQTDQPHAQGDSCHVRWSEHTARNWRETHSIAKTP
jgi:hypothetical protein